MRASKERGGVPEADTQQAMASTNNSASTGRGAAEEPGPEPGDSVSSSSTTTTSYDPTVFQRPHPDDRGAGGKTRSGKGSGKTDALEDNDKDNSKSKDKSKGGLSLDFCGNCGAEGELRKCKQCGVVAYCGEACQRVSAMAGAGDGAGRAGAPR